MEGAMWRHGLGSYLSLVLIVSVFCSYNSRTWGLQPGNRKPVEQSLYSWPPQESQNISLSFTDELACGNSSKISENCSETIGKSSGELMTVINELQKKEGEDESGVAPDYVLVADRQIHRPRHHSWIGNLVPKLAIIVVVITVVAVAICCVVHVMRPDLIKSQRYMQDQTIPQQQINGNI